MLSPEEIMTLKESIYSVVTDEDILSHYLGIEIGIINNLLLDKNSRICNPLRVDNNPSLGMMRTTTSNKIIIKDFADPSYTGDVFDLVGFITNNNPNSRDGFINICNSIMTNLVLNNSDITIIPTANKKTIQNKVVYHNDNIPFVVFNDRGWDNTTLRFWHNHTRNKLFTSKLYDLLRIEKVYIPATIFSNDKLIYSFKPTDIAYLYFYGLDHTGNSIVKAYFPNRGYGNTFNTMRFFTNDQHKYRGLQTNTETATKMVMTKSMKDALLLRVFLNIAGLEQHVNIYYVQGEAYQFKPDELNTLTAPYDTVIWFMDFDKTGIYNTYYHTNINHNIIPIFIAGKDITINLTELHNIASKINTQLNINLTGYDIQILINKFTIRPYFNGVKDFADILEVKSLKYAIRYFKLLAKTYLKDLVKLS
jgi:hypothetical protein